MGGGEAGSFYNLECFARATEFGPAILDFQLPTVFFNARNVRAGSPGWSPVSVKTRRSMNYPRDMGEAYHSFSYFEKTRKAIAMNYSCRILQSTPHLPPCRSTVIGKAMNNAMCRIH